MKHFAGWVLTAGLLLPGVGCDSVVLEGDLGPVVGEIVGLLRPERMTVTLVNESTIYDVDVTLFFHDDNHVFEFMLTQVGEEVGFILLPGDEISFTEKCDDLQVIVIDDANLQLFGGTIADTESPILREGDDFECGDEIVFTFTHSNLVVDFDVFVDVR